MSRLLLVEDDARVRASLTYQLEADGHALTAAASAEEALAGPLSASRPAPDLLLLDVRLPGESGVELVRRLAGEGRLPPTIILSGEASITETVEALRLGVHDFLEKPFSRERLLQAVRNALESEALKRRVAALESRLEEARPLLGRSPAMDRLRRAIEQAAPTDGRVLVAGESGSGKELVAAALHRGSRRAAGPFVKLNCAAIPEHLIEDELFGHARGAFTDAKASKAGLFEEADGGTLFLDEIGDMGLALQARLLRVLEDGEVRRLGDTKGRKVDVRVIAATHRDLEAEVAAGRFRADLYFRLAHLPVEVPALRERREDIAFLLDHFLDAFAASYRLRRKRVDPALLPPLESYRWPGNVRELASLAERLTVFGSDPLTPDQLPTAFFRPAPEGETGLLRVTEGLRLLPWKEFKAASERDYLEAVLQRTGWNLAAAARLLGLQRTYLHQKLGALGLERPRPGGQ
ncbi:MAG TPA: sigma-54 dependent transcriptional regulator [Thermoanaerobaculia bacterium]|nr:sigma-54 dependent transcriptional regulator [Thermoanaerobaculia bacterium]